MKYIDIINNFWLVNDEYSFQPTAVALYFYLLKINNGCYWKESFKHNNKKIEATLDISYKSLSNARNQLKQAGLIKFKTQNGISNVTYSLTFVKKDEVRDEGGDEVRTRSGTRFGRGNGIVNKDKDKTREELEKRKQEFASTLKPFLETYGKDMLNDFYSYWTQPNKSNTKLGFELQKTWSLAHRLSTWAKRDKNFNKVSVVKETKEEKRQRKQDLLDNF